MFDLLENSNKIKISKHGIVKQKNKLISIIFKVPTTSAKFTVKSQANIFTLEAQVIKGYPCVMSCKGLFEDGSILIPKNPLKLCLNIPNKLIGNPLNFQIHPQGGKGGSTEINIKTFRISNGEKQTNIKDEDCNNQLLDNLEISEQINQIQNLIQNEKKDNTHNSNQLPATINQEVENYVENEGGLNVKTEQLVEVENEGIKVENEGILEVKNEDMDVKWGESIREDIDDEKDESELKELSARVRIERLGIKDILKRLKKLEKNL